MTRHVGTAFLVVLAALAAAGVAARAAEYKKEHRGQITRIAKGEIEPAIAAADAYLRKHPDDIESHFVLAVGWAQQGDIDRAMAHVRQGVAGGLPFGRFLAGPRDLLAPLVESPAFQAFAKDHAPLLVHGPMVGSVTDSRARFWVRTAREAQVEVVVGESPDLAGPAGRGAAGTQADADFTAVVEVTGLQPATRYHYRVLVDGREALDAPAEFRTFPKAGEPAAFDVIFGGGAGYTPQHERMWTTLASRRPLAMLFMGDNVYIDAPKSPTVQRYCYYRRRSRPEFRAFAASTAAFAIWDDHDFGDDNSAGGPDPDKPAWKRAVLNVFRENWVNPSYGGGEAQPGCWFRFAIGDVDFFMLDCRYWRDRKAKPPSMLGPVQKAWLKEALGASTATFKVVASSVPWALDAKPGSKDHWGGFMEERDELFSFLADRRVGGVVLLSADRHRTDLWDVEPARGCLLYEFSSSKLTNDHTNGVIRESLYGYAKTCSFGLLSFDTTRDEPQVTYRIGTIDNQIVHEFTLKRSQLNEPP
ncbi:MAG TPA: alkaline phosphatase D family protein [Phycisphaerae bacterium]|nr:alkaline phosphatase D family protein [Phycisphaerae bacterium]